MIIGAITDDTHGHVPCSVRTNICLGEIASAASNRAQPSTAGCAVLDGDDIPGLERLESENKC